MLANVHDTLPVLSSTPATCFVCRFRLLSLYTHSFLYFYVEIQRKRKENTKSQGQVEHKARSILEALYSMRNNNLQKESTAVPTSPSLLRRLESGVEAVGRIPTTTLLYSAIMVESWRVVIQFSLHFLFGLSHICE